MPFSRRPGELAASLAQPDQPDPGDAPRPLEVGLQSGVVDRLHRGHGLADPERRGRSRRSSTDPKWRPTNRTALPGHDGLGDQLGRVDLEPLVDVGGRDRSVRGRPRGSSGRGAGTPSGPAARARSGRSRRPGRPGLPTPGRRERRAHPAQVPARLGGAIGRQPVPQVAGRGPASAEERPLREPAGEPRGREQEPATRASQRASASRDLVRRVAWQAARGPGIGLGRPA